MKYSYVTLDVFSDSPFTGNPLAVVHIPRSAPISQRSKQLIAREFNFSETVFLHERLDGERAIHPIDIFTATEELPFAGHPTVGTASVLLNKGELEITLRTKAGDVSARRDGGRVSLVIPQDLHVHGSAQHPRLKGELQLADEAYLHGKDGPEPVVSIVKGMTFLLLQLTSVSALEGMHTPQERLRLPKEVEDEWSGVFAGLYAFVDLGYGELRSRMFDGRLEDPATGSAATTLAGYLALKKGAGTWKFHILQGVEMGRRSEIFVSVEVNKDRTIEKIELAGSAIKVMEGVLNTSTC